MNRALPLLLIASIPLSACATKGEYPSLSRRDAERITGIAQPSGQLTAPAPVPPPNAQISARLFQLVEQARVANGQFAEQRGRSERLVAQGAGSAPSSEGWAVASIALAELESARNDTMVAMTSIDEIQAADALAHYNTPSGDAPAIAAAQAQVAGWIDQQDVVLDALGRKLGG